MVFLFLHQLVDEKASPARLLDMSNQFFTMIPHDFGMKKPPVLDTTELIQVMIVVCIHTAHAQPLRHMVVTALQRLN